MVEDLRQPAEAPTVYIDGVRREAPGADVTGAQLLALVGKSPDAYDLFARGHHPLRIPAEEAVEVREGAEFETRPRL